MPKKRQPPPPPAPAASFWASFPALLTGVAALITAIVGVLVFLNQRDGDGKPAAQAVITVQTARLPADQRTEFATHQVVLRVTGQPELLAKVDRVTYLLPPSFGSDSFTSAFAGDGFAVRLAAAGSFTAQAKLHLKSGGTLDASQQVELPAT